MRVHNVEERGKQAQKNKKVGGKKRAEGAFKKGGEVKWALRKLAWESRGSVTQLTGYLQAIMRVPALEKVKRGLLISVSEGRYPKLG